MLVLTQLKLIFKAQQIREIISFLLHDKLGKGRLVWPNELLQI